MNKKEIEKYRKNILTKEFLEKEYIKNKKSTPEISKIINIPKYKIYEYLKKYNISIRNISESQKICQKGSRNGNYKHGKFLRKYFCKICGKEISMLNGIYGQGNCIICCQKIKIHTSNCQCGYCKSKRGEFKGKNHPSYIDGRTLKKYYCKTCKINEISYNTFWFGKGDCNKCKSKLMKNGNWKNGKSKIGTFIKRLIEFENWRNKIFKRDSYTCQLCFKKGGNLHAHHIKPFSLILSEFLQQYSQFSPMEDKETLVRLAMTYEPFWDVNNGITLCKICHKTTNNFLKHESKK